MKVEAAAERNRRESAAMLNDPILSVCGLRTYFFTPSGIVKAVDDVSFDLLRGEILAIVGESGSGKSVTALSLMKLVASPPGRYVSGEILLDGRNVLACSEGELEEIRGRRISMIFQNPRAALNPSFTILTQLSDTIRRHDLSLTRTSARKQALTRLAELGVPDPERVGMSYPHQISSGMCQRTGLALAMASHPDILIADEPTTMLDAWVQARILLMLKRMHLTRGLPIILITHDFGVVRALATRVIVMYAGRVQEEGTADTIFENPQHPYTRALIDSVPRPDRSTHRLYQIPGQPPDLSRLPPGCSFADRCDSVMPICRTKTPELYISASRSLARCHLFASEDSSP